jgi:hypothetical protein
VFGALRPLFDIHPFFVAASHSPDGKTHSAVGPAITRAR